MRGCLEDVALFFFGFFVSYEDEDDRIKRADSRLVPRQLAPVQHAFSTRLNVSALALTMRRAFNAH